MSDPAIPAWFLELWRNCGVKVNNAGLLQTGRNQVRIHQIQDLYTLLCVYEQTHVLRQGEDEITIEDGQVCLLPPGRHFAVMSPPGPDFGMTYRMEFFMIRGVGQPDPLSLLPLPAVAQWSNALDRADSLTFWSDLLGHFDGWRPKPGASLLRYRPLAERLLVEVLTALFASGIGEAAPGERIPGWLWDLRTWLRGKYLEADLNACALRTGYSASQVSHAFKKHFGTSPMAFVREQRIALACRFLSEQPDSPIGEIAERCGFNGASQFARAFTAAIGRSPSRWRREQRGGICER